MKRVETLSGKNLPRLAVAKPGWPEPDGLRQVLEEQVAYGRTIDIPKVLADFTLVCDQTGPSEKLRKD